MNACQRGIFATDTKVESNSLGIQRSTPWSAAPGCVSTTIRAAQNGVDNDRKRLPLSKERDAPKINDP